MQLIPVWRFFLHAMQQLDDETINLAIMTDNGRRWVAGHLARASRLTPEQLYRRLCETPPDGAQGIPDDAWTLVEADPAGGRSARLWS